MRVHSPPMTQGTRIDEHYLDLTAAAMVGEILALRTALVFAERLIEPAVWTMRVAPHIPAVPELTETS